MAFLFPPCLDQMNVSGRAYNPSTILKLVLVHWMLSAKVTD
jgi:hypothetical protein